jgi:hypothetical protein
LNYFFVFKNFKNRNSFQDRSDRLLHKENILKKLKCLNFFLSTIREHKIRAKIAKTEKDPREIDQDELKLCFNNFLRFIATKNRWFKLHKHPNDPLIRVEDFTDKETSIFLIESIAAAIHMFLFNKQAIFEEKIDENLIKVDLLTIDGINNNFFTKIIFFYFDFFY